MPRYLQLNSNRLAIQFGERSLVGDVIPRGSVARLLALHGAGPATSRSAYSQLRELLFLRGISSCAFDFIGHGETGGFLAESSLEERTQQALAVAESGGLAPQFAILAASMSGYTALRLLAHRPVRDLVLLVPAAYAAEAYKVTFSGGFREVIRECRSWARSDAWEILRTFTGRLLVIAAEHDTVVPMEVTERYIRSAENAAERMLHVVPGSPHKLLQFLAGNPGELSRVVNLIADFLSRSA